MSLIPPLSTHDIGDREHFGFVDGTSQPCIDWSRQKPDPVGKSSKYSNLSALGEFLLGYPNEYNRYTARPLLNLADDNLDVLPLAEDEPGKKDFCRNGTFLVFRDLEQNTEAFSEFVADEAGPDETKRRNLAGSMVGRLKAEIPIMPPGPINIAHDDAAWVNPDGVTPVLLQNLPMKGVGPKLKDIWLNRFTYGEDLSGTACPNGAHVRRANPRTGDLPAGTGGWISRALRTLGFDRSHFRDDLVSSTRFHRILRRGREYQESTGSGKSGRSGKKKAGSSSRGLRFICLNANISRQFEFVQSAWIENPKFDGLNDSDPLLGSRAPLWAGGQTDGYSVPQDNGIGCEYASLPQFVTVRGGAYFFMPGLRTLRFITSL